jgi:hypothetical protein
MGGVPELIPRTQRPGKPAIMRPRRTQSPRRKQTRIVVILQATRREDMIVQAGLKSTEKQTEC